MKPVSPTAAHRAFRDELIALLRRNDDLSALEMLAVASHLVGQLVALQDQRALTPGEAMEIVAANIEAGNRSALDGILDTKGRA